MRTLLILQRLLFISLLGLPASTARAQYCNVTWTTSGVEPITLVDFGSINNATATTSTVGLENFTSMTASVLQGTSYPITVKCNTFGNYTNYIRVYIDWNQNNVFTDAGESFDVGTITNSTGVDAIQASLSIPVPLTSGLGNTRMRVMAKWSSYPTSCNTSGYGQAEDYTINILSANSCVGTPAAGTVTGPSVVCPSISFSLSLTGYTAASGISIQWQEDIGTGWQSIAGATNASYTETSGITSQKSYRATVTCINGGGNDVSNGLTISVNPPTQCYCSITYPLSGAGPISLVSFGSINNVTNASINQPAYEDFTAQSTSLLQGQSSTLTVKGNTVGNYTDTIKAYIDWNQNGFFTDPGETYYLGNLVNSTGVDAIQASMSITVPLTATIGQTRMRVTKKYQDLTYSGPCNQTGYGQAEDYTIDVLAVNSCTGTPAAGTVSGSASVCANTQFTLTLSGNTVAVGVTVQWQSYDNSTSTWQNISGATGVSYTSSGITASTDYRAVVTCTNGGAFANTSGFNVAITPFLNCYCTPASSGGTTITNVDIPGTTLNNSSASAPAPNYYIAYPASGSTTATLMQGVTYNLNGSFGAAAIASVWIDYDQNGVYDASEWTQITTNATSGVTSFTVPIGAATGLTGMRIRARAATLANSGTDACTTFGSGETEDYLVTITSAVSCGSIPASGTASAPATACPNIPFTLTLANYTVAQGIGIQWEENTGSSWQPISGATSGAYYVSGGISTATSYRAVVTCTITNQSATSNSVSVALTPASQCYCSINFASGVEPITLVTFNAINNASSDVINGSPASEDYTTVNTNLGAGSSYQLTVKGNTDGNYTDYIRVFFDWNQNGILSDAGEAFDLGTITNSTGLDAIQASQSITVPASAVYGTTRMRVTKKWNSYATACNVTGYGQAEDYLVQVMSPLTIKLRDLQATNIGSRNKIQWLTMTEMRGDYFELERSIDAASFATIATVNAKGEPCGYTYWDEQPLPGINYYRLKMSDAAGTVSYSTVVKATVLDVVPFFFSVQPNPAGNTIVVTITDPGENGRVMITDVQGRVAKQLPAVSKQVIDISDLVPGIYLLKYTDTGKSHTIKLHKH